MHFIKNNISIIILMVIIVLSAFLRLYKLSEIPNGLYVDEAAIGYNAYSILETGKDEYGKAFPIFLRSYGAYSSPLYTYVTILFVYLWGLTISSTRFLSAFSGTLTVVFVYLIFKKIQKSQYLALLGTFLFAISPWSVFFSRGAFEATFACFILILALYFLVLARQKLWYLIVCFTLLSVSTYAYQAERLIVFLFIPFALWWLGRKRLILFLRKKEVYLALILFIFIQIPQLSLLGTDAFGSRATGIFYKDAVSAQAGKIFLPYTLSLPLSFMREFLSNYVAYFSPKNLFFLPDPDLQRSIPDMSVLYPWMVAPFVVGLYVFAKNLKDHKNWWPILFLLISSPIPAALTKDPFSTLRSLPLVIPLCFIISLGIFSIWKVLPRTLSLVFIAGVVIYTGIIFWRSYFVLLPQERANDWDYGFSELSKIVQDKPQTHFVIDQSRMNPAYILLAFHTKYPPEQMQSIVDQTIKDDYYNNTDFESSYSFLNIETRPIRWEDDIYAKQILVGDRYAISDNQIKEHHLTKVFEIHDPLHEPIFIGYETDPSEKCLSIKNANSRCTIH